MIWIDRVGDVRTKREGIWTSVSGDAERILLREIEIDDVAGVHETASETCDGSGRRRRSVDPENESGNEAF